MNTEQQKPNNSPQMIRIPIVIAISLVAGLFIGATLFSGKHSLGSILKSYGKYKEVLSLIETSYVDSVDTDSLVDFSIQKMLEKLDPHTTYFPASEANLVRSGLESGFDGIGVEFNIYRDTVFVTTPLAGGPSEQAGIQSGDMILKADSTKLTGPKVTNATIFGSLRGKRGSEVNLTIKRKNKLMTYLIKRDRIPSFSVSAGYMIDAKTGYMKVDRFSESTFNEFKTTLESLKTQGMQQFVLDLRGNSGGFMDRATDMVDELVAGNKLIVYTDGKGTTYDRKTFANKNGAFETGNVIVLVDENSASAAEIVAGSLQDNDRALVIGRRSFGKGLVQMPVTLTDGSELRLTISRYYIPSGRSVQKPYVLGEGDENYDKDYENRMKSGELFNVDSAKADKTKQFKTLSGRIVYGGGGVTPDVFVAKDTSYYSKLLYEIWSKNIIRTYSSDYARENASLLKSYNFKNYLDNFVVSDKMYAEMLNMAKKNGVIVNEKDTNLSKKYIISQIKAYIARSNWQRKTNKNGLNNEYFQVMAVTDDVLKKAVDSFKNQQLMLLTKK